MTMHASLKNYEEAYRIDGAAYNWTPHVGKVPCHPGWPDTVSSSHFIEQCYDADRSIGNGILTGKNKRGERFGVIDFDDRNFYEDFASRIRIDTTVALTQRGVHVFVRGELPNRIKLGGKPIDLISERKFVAAPLRDGPTANYERRWLTPLRPVHKLAEFDAAWFPEISIQPKPEPKSRTPLVSQSVTDRGVGVGRSQSGIFQHRRMRR